MSSKGLFGKVTGVKTMVGVSAKNTDGAVVRPEAVVFDFLKNLGLGVSEYNVLRINMNMLRSQSIKATQRRGLVDTFENVTQKSNSEVLCLPNEDMVIFYRKKCIDEVKACLVKVHFMFRDDPAVKDSDDLEEIGFVKIYDLSADKDLFQKDIKDVLARFSQEAEAAPKKEFLQSSAAVFNTSTKKFQRQMTPDMLSKIQKILSMADFSSFIRRQSICAVIGKAPPQRVFEEVYVSIPDLREMLLPDVDLTSNPWLFLSLSETLDKRVLEIINRHDDSSLAGNFSVNINVSTILSDDFLEFDDNISASMRSTVILELQLTDIFSDIKAYMLVRNFTQSRGYKICIDGVTVDKLKYLNRVNLDSDLIKIIWHPSFMDIVREDGHFIDYVNKAERAKMILCRIDDPQAVEVGNNLGINLYQGRYIQRMLNAQPKRTFFAPRK